MITKLSILVFSKDRPLFLKTCLESLGNSSFAVTVLYLVTTEVYTKAYAELIVQFPEVKFVNQTTRGDLKPYLQGWLETATDPLMVTVDDNVFNVKINTEAICNTMADPTVFGFTLRLAPGICRTQDNRVSKTWPEATGEIVFYEPASYQIPWNYVWEMSSTFYHKHDMQRVVESFHIPNPNELEIVGLRLFNFQTVKKMACFRQAPATNVFVDSWMSPHCVTSGVPNETAFRLYQEGREIDLARTFQERDQKGLTHVKRLFLKPKKLTNKAIAVIPARNVEKWVAQCLQSVLGQTYPDLGIVFIDDLSEDRTYEIAFGLLVNKPDAVVVSRADRRYALENIDFAVRECCANPESVVFLVDGDDWLAIPTAIEEMMGQHQTAEVVWSKYQCSGGQAGISGLLRNNDIRHHPWTTSHLRSFKKFLFDAIKPVDFLDVDGKMYRMTWDMAIMMPILEQVPPNLRKFYDKVLYIYNRDNPANDDKVSRAEQLRMEARIRGFPIYALHPRYQSNA
jgi:hypothetical protein